MKMNHKLVHFSPSFNALRACMPRKLRYTYSWKKDVFLTSLKRILASRRQESVTINTNFTLIFLTTCLRLDKDLPRPCYDSLKSYILLKKGLDSGK